MEAVAAVEAEEAAVVAVEMVTAVEMVSAVAMVTAEAEVGGRAAKIAVWASAASSDCDYRQHGFPTYHGHHVTVTTAPPLASPTHVGLQWPCQLSSRHRPGGC